MDYETLLMKQLSRQHIDYVAHCIGDNNNEFDKLMKIVLHGKEPVVQRAAWAMTACLEKHPEWLSPYVEIIINNISLYTNNGVRRNLIKGLANCKIPEHHKGLIVDISFRWIQSSETPVGIKVHCLQILSNIAKQYPEIASELQTVIIEQIPRNSAGFASRGRKILHQKM